MRLLVLSDLHLELWREEAPKIDVAVSRPDAVILAGDIHSGARAIPWAAETFGSLPVLYVHGNHEAYGHNLDETPRDIRQACKAYPNIHFLDCDEVVLGGVRFLGATLWTDFKLFGEVTRFAAMFDSQNALNDYKRIRIAKDGYRKLKPADTAQLHGMHRGWLQRKLAEPFDGKTVVVTHMAPSMQSVASHYKDDMVSAAFASNADHLVDQADVWVHGHTHTGFDYPLGRCRVVCNPCGYRNRDGSTENEVFDPNLIVEV